MPYEVEAPYYIEILLSRQITGLETCISIVNVIQEFLNGFNKGKKHFIAKQGNTLFSFTR